MLMALDLTTRQGDRVLAQAVRTHAKFEIEPRPEFLDSPLWGSLESRDQNLLIVNLTNAGKEVPAAALVGVMCDVRTILSEQLYMFSTVIVEAADAGGSRRLTLAVPDAIQVANRRRFARKSSLEPIPVRLTVPGAPESFVGSMANINRTGLGCRVKRRELDGLLLIGEEVQVEFMLPWAHQVYTLPSEVCTKTPCEDREYMLAGFEFVAKTPASQASLDLLRTALDSETERLTDMEDGQ